MSLNCHGLIKTNVNILNCVALTTFSLLHFGNSGLKLFGAQLLTTKVGTQLFLQLLSLALDRSGSH